MLRHVLGTLLGLSLCVSAAAQAKTPPTKRQRESLEPLVTWIAHGLELQVPSVLAKDAVIRVRRALSDQTSNVALEAYEELVVELIAEDMSLSSKDRDLVRRGVLREFGQSFRELDLELLQADEEEWAQRDKKDLLLPTADIRWMHERCIYHRPDTLLRLEGWITVFDLEKDEERGIDDLAEWIAGDVQEKLGIERRDKRFVALLESALMTNDTDRAMLGALCKVRGIVRPLVYGLLEIGEGFEERIDAEALVHERLAHELPAEWWAALRADHAAMIRDPKAHRKVIAERKKKR